MKNKKLRVKVRENCDGNSWSVTVFEGKKLFKAGPYKRKYIATRRAKKVAEQTGILYSDEIVKQHGC